MKNSGKLAFCSVIAALSTVVMLLTGLVPVATVALPAVAGCLLIPVVAECGVKWGFGVYAAAGVLSFLLAGDREAMLIYLLFFGYYPVLYALLDRIRSRVLRYLVKLLLFNAAAVSEGLLTVYVLGIPFESLPFLGPFTAVVLLLAANAVFVLYDYALRGLIAVYYSKLRKMVSGLFRGK